ncbi:hypothetical protein pclt_cds_150 [Pandoravirus celtis]|uniref:DUF5902 domain-containing protein n=1 Tax=Pandoravirus celtis TaxID=2568002 RepID=A0A4D6EGS7_9VIRU|nr:hypothetical protein pclt_cds_150 [Pandoravirus celtis]
MQTPQPDFSSLPTEVLGTILSALDLGESGDVIAACSANAQARNVCNTALVDWRTRYPQIASVYRPEPGTGRLMTVLEAARHLERIRRLQQKCALYGLWAYAAARAFFYDEHNRERGLGRGVDTWQTVLDEVVRPDPNAGDSAYSIGAVPLAALDAWVQSDGPQFVGFYRSTAQGLVPDPDGSDVVYVIGPIGPGARLLSRDEVPARLFAVRDANVGAGPEWLLSAASRPAFVNGLVDGANRNLTAAMGTSLHGPAVDGMRAYAVVGPGTDGSAHQQCSDVDLFRAYPDAQLYLVASASRPRLVTAGVALGSA